MRPRSTGWLVLAVVLIVALAAVLRFPFLGDGLPQIYNVDDMNRVEIVMNMLEQRSLDPGWFGHPAQTVIYPMAAIAALVYVAGVASGLFSNGRDFALWFYGDPSTLYIAWQTCILAVSVLTVAATFLLARLYAGRMAAIVAALCVALAPSHIAASSQLRSSDIVMSLFLLLSVYFAMRSYDAASDRRTTRAAFRYSALSGLFVGLATASKFYGVFAAVSVTAAHFLRHRLQWNRFPFLALAAGCSLLGAFLAGPFLFIKFPEVVANVMAEARDTHLSATAPGFFEDLWWFLAEMATGSLGPILSVAALVGLASGVARRWRDTAITFGAPLVLLLFLALLPLRWERWVLGLVPFAAILAGAGVASVSTFLTDRFGVVVRRGAFVIVLPLIFSWSLVVSGQSVLELSHPRTQDVARDWIAANIEPGTRLYVEGHGPWLDRRTYPTIPRKESLAGTSYGFAAVPPPAFPIQVDFEFLCDNRVAYIVEAGWQQRMRESRYPERFADTLAVYDELNRNAVTVFDTADHPQKLRGLRIRISRIVGYCEANRK